MSVKEVAADHVVLSDGTTIKTRTVVWGGGELASPLAAQAGLPVGRGGRVDVQADLSVEGVSGVWVLGDAAGNILVAIEGRPPRPFVYHDKGIMAMIGRNAAVAEVGARRHGLHGPVAFAACLGVHAWLLSGARERVDAFIRWGWDYFSHGRASAVLDRPDAAWIGWDEDDTR